MNAACNIIEPPLNQRNNIHSLSNYQQEWKTI